MALKSKIIIDALNRLQATKAVSEDGLSPADRYFIFRRADSEEHHIFKGTWNPIFKKCSRDEDVSICKKMDLKTVQERKAHEVFSCLDEEEARERCLELRRDVCGTCVSNLYAT